MTKLVPAASLSVLALLAPLSACVDDPDGLDDALGETEQEVTGTTVPHLACPGADAEYGCALELGPTSGRVCLLAGLDGDLYHTSPHAFVDGVIIRASSTSHEYSLRTLGNEDGLAIGGSATCTSLPPQPPFRQQTYVWHVGDAPISLGSTASGRQCFLTGVSSYRGFTQADDYVAVYTTGREWMLGGSQHGETRGDVTARCINVNATVSTHTVTSTGPTVQQFLAGNANHDVACALTKIGGFFTIPTDSIRIGGNPWPGLVGWRITLTGTKTAGVTCFR